MKNFTTILAFPPFLFLYTWHPHPATKSYNKNKTWEKDQSSETLINFWMLRLFRLWKTFAVVKCSYRVRQHREAFPIDSLTVERLTMTMREWLEQSMSTGLPVRRCHCCSGDEEIDILPYRLDSILKSFWRKAYPPLANIFQNPLCEDKVEHVFEKPGDRLTHHLFIHLVFSRMLVLSGHGFLGRYRWSLSTLGMHCWRWMFSSAIQVQLVL